MKVKLSSEHPFTPNFAGTQSINAWGGRAFAFFAASGLVKANTRYTTQNTLDRT